jgi:dephospho-CoA kinase
MIIFGITGTNGSGKGTVVKYLIKKGFVHYSVRDFLTNKIKEQKRDINRTSMRELADSLREKYGPSYVIEKILENSIEKNKNCIIESIRCPGEVKFLKKFNNFFLIAVDADRKTRFNRIKKRKSSTDIVDFENFIKQEEAELNNKEPFKMNIIKCIELSDYKFINNEGFSSLYNQINNMLDKIQNEKG